MQELMTKYMNAFHDAKGSELKKIKTILMQHSDSWDWAGSDSIIADLLDDRTLTADDLVDFLSRAYEDEGGSEEFHYAVRALQISLRKARLQAIKARVVAEEETDDFESIESNSANCVTFMDRADVSKYFNS